MCRCCSAMWTKPVRLALSVYTLLCAATWGQYLGVCRLVKYMFLEAGAMQSESYCRDESPWAPLLLGPHCPLFARKFPENTSSQVCAHACSS